RRICTRRICAGRNGGRRGLLVATRRGGLGALHLARTAAVAQMHAGLIADRDAAQILFGELGTAHDVRYERDQEFLAFAIDALAGEQAAQKRDAGQPRDSGYALGILLAREAA